MYLRKKKRKTTDTRVGNIKFISIVILLPQKLAGEAKKTEDQNSIVSKILVFHDF